MDRAAASAAHRLRGTHVLVLARRADTAEVIGVALVGKVTGDCLDSPGKPPPGPAAWPPTTTSVTPLPPVAEFTTLLPRIEQLSTQLKACPSAGAEADAAADRAAGRPLQLIGPLGRDLRMEILARPDGQQYTEVLGVLAMLDPFAVTEPRPQLIRGWEIEALADHSADLDLPDLAPVCRVCHGEFEPLGVPLGLLYADGSLDPGAFGLDYGQRHIVAVLQYIVRD